MIAWAPPPRPTEWSPEAAELWRWFLASPVQREPFALARHRWVCDPGQMWRWLRREYEKGPSWCEARNRVTVGTLRRLREVQGG